MQQPDPDVLRKDVDHDERVQQLARLIPVVLVVLVDQRYTDPVAIFVFVRHPYRQLPLRELERIELHVLNGTGAANDGDWLVFRQCGTARLLPLEFFLSGPVGMANTVSV